MIKPEGALHPVAQARLRGRIGRPDMVAVGVIIWLASELMFFAALFAAYFTIRNVTNSQALDAGTEPLWLTSTEHDQHPVRDRQHDGAGREFLHLPDGCVRGRARTGQADRVRAQHPGLGTARVVRADLLDGRLLHRRPGLRVRRAVQRGSDHVDQRVLVGVLPGHRLPRAACHRRAGRLRLTVGTDVPGPDVHPRAGGQRRCSVLLLALRRRRVDRPVRRHLSACARAVSRTLAGASEDASTTEYFPGSDPPRGPPRAIPDRKTPAPGSQGAVVGVRALCHGRALRGGGSGVEVIRRHRHQPAGGARARRCSRSSAPPATGSTARVRSAVRSRARRWSASVRQRSSSRWPPAGCRWPGPAVQAPQKEPVFTEEEVLALAAFVDTLGPGPAIPEPAKYDPAGLTEEEIARGGELFRTNCSACHNFEGAGRCAARRQVRAGAVRRQQPAPLRGDADRSSADAGVLRRARCPIEDKRAIIGYLNELHEQPNRGGLAFGGLGPVAEGLWAWIAGLGVLIGFAIWIAAKGVKAR